MGALYNLKLEGNERVTGSTLSLAMIVKNESEIITRCLDSVESACDEIIIVDTGSTDNTVELVKKYPQVKVHHFKWVRDFGAARNESFKHATGDLILWLDADDVIKKEDLETLKSLKTKPISEHADCYICSYEYAHDQYDNVVLSLPRERIFKRSINPRWKYKIHECIPLDNFRKVEKLNFKVHHYRKESHAEQNKDRNTSILRTCVENPKTNCARYEFYYGKELADQGHYTSAQKYLKDYLKHWEYYEDAYFATYKLAEMSFAENRRDDAINYCFDALKIDQQKPELFCLLGLLYVSKGRWDLAKFWYEAALRVEMPKDKVGFFPTDAQGWTPHFQLCFVYNNLGDFKKALYHIEEALKINPKDKVALSNRDLLRKVVSPEISKKAVEYKAPDTPLNSEAIAIYIPFSYDINNPNIRLRKVNIQKAMSRNGRTAAVVQDFNSLLSYGFILAHVPFSHVELRKLKQAGKIIAYDLAEGVFDPLLVETMKDYNLVFCSSTKLAAEAYKMGNMNAVHLPDSYED